MVLARLAVTDYSVDMDDEKTVPKAKSEGKPAQEPEIEVAPCPNPEPCADHPRVVSPAATAEARPEFTAADRQDHTGTVCPFCSINGVCGHQVKFPAVCGAAPWLPNVWVKGP